MIAFFAQRQFAAGSGFPKLPNGLFFGGGGHAIHQLGVELLGIVTVMAAVFCLSFATVAVLARVFGGIINHPPRTPSRSPMPALRPTSGIRLQATRRWHQGGTACP